MYLGTRYLPRSASRRPAYRGRVCPTCTLHLGRIGGVAMHITTINQIQTRSDQIGPDQTRSDQVISK